MAISIVDKVTNLGFDRTPTVLLPTVQDGDVGIIVYTSNGGPSDSFSLPTGWVEVETTQHGGSNNNTCLVGTKTLTAAESGTDAAGAENVTNTAPWSAALLVLRGAALDGHTVSVDTTNGTGVDIPAHTPAAANCIDVVVASYTLATSGASGTVTGVTGYTEQADVCQNNASRRNAGIYIGTKQLSGQAGTEQSASSITTDSEAAGGTAWRITLSPVATAATTVRPNAVVENGGNYTNEGGAASIPAALSDDSDTTYAQSPDSPSAATLTVGVPLLAEGDVTVKVRHAASAASPSISRKYELMDGATVITSRTLTLPTAVTAYQFTTTAAETANITDFSALRLRVTDSTA